MFGYVKPEAALLRMYEMEQYNAIYCGICAELGRRLGATARIRLSYDHVFVALLHARLHDVPLKVEKGSCAVFPLRKRMVFRDEETLRYAVDTAVILGYYKIEDDKRDKPASVSRLWSGKYAKKLRKVQERRTELCEQIRTAMEEQEKAESAKNCSIDEAANPTACMMGSLMCHMDERLSQRLYDMGYALGRYVYLMDAADDAQTDAAHKRFNPFNTAGFDREQMEGAICLSIREVMEKFDDLDFGRESAILNNIVYKGLAARKDEVFGRKDKNDRPI